MWHCSRCVSAAAESDVYLLDPVNHAWAAESAFHLIASAWISSAVRFSSHVARN